MFPGVSWWVVRGESDWESHVVTKYRRVEEQELCRAQSIH